MERTINRRQFLVAAAPLVVAAAPLAGLASMIGPSVPSPAGPHEHDHLLYPPEALPHQPGRVRAYDIVAIDRDLEVVNGVTFAAWTYNGTEPGPIIRATEDDLLRVNFRNAGSHPHTIHFHGIHPANMDGVFQIVGSMEHNITEGLGIATPIAEGRRVSPARLAALALVAGAPAIAGAWVGGFLANDFLGVLFFSLAVGAALQVVVEVGRYLRQRAPGGLGSGWVVGCFLAGIVVMWTTELITG